MCDAACFRGVGRSCRAFDFPITLVKLFCPYVRLKHTPNRLVPEQSYRQGCSGRCPVSPTLRRVCCGCGTSNHTHLAGKSLDATNCVLIENFPCISILCKWAWDNIGDTHYLCSGVARYTDGHLHDDTDCCCTWSDVELLEPNVVTATGTKKTVGGTQQRLSHQCSVWNLWGTIILIKLVPITIVHMTILYTCGVPRLLLGGGKKNLVATVCACAKFGGIPSK